MIIITILIIITLLFIAFIAWGAKLNSENNARLRSNGFIPNIKIAGLQIDEEHGLWNKAGMDMTLKLSEITDCEVIEDGISYKSDNGVLRAVIGGAIFGSVGAIVGAVTSSSSENIKYMYVLIHTNNEILKQVKVNLITTTTSKNSSSYRMSKSSAEAIIRYIDKISGFSDRKKIDTNSLSPATPVDLTVSAADELAKYKKLLDDGAITEEEYAEVKKKLLTI